MAIMCEKCGKRPATTLTKVYINGVYSEQYLCSECDKSLMLSHELFPDNIITSLFGVAAAPKKRRGIKVCRNCGTTEKEFLDSYRLGCVECYETFADIIDSCVEKLSNGNEHRGKSPKGLQIKNSNRDIDNNNLKTSVNDKMSNNSNADIELSGRKNDSIEERMRLLRIELKKAVEEERYDDAGSIKRELDELKKKEM